MPAFLSSLAFKLIAGAVLILIVLVSVTQCTGQRKAAEQAKQDARGSDAMAVTAKEAAETVIQNASDSATVDQLVTAAAKRIEDAPTPEVAAIEARSAICAFPEYRNKPECRP